VCADVNEKYYDFTIDMFRVMNPNIAASADRPDMAHLAS
jgi:hypothetical protein